jgi:hypothetical protein
MEKESLFYQMEVVMRENLNLIKLMELYLIIININLGYFQMDRK